MRALTTTVTSCCAGEIPPALAPGWRPLRVEATYTAVRIESSLLIVPGGQVLGNVSDVDDTVIVSELTDRSRLLTHIFLEYPLQRQPIPGMAGFCRRIASRNALPDAAPVVYLTAAPRQLLPAIRSSLEHN